LLIGGAALIPARRLLREIRDPDRGAVPDVLGIALLAGAIGLLSLGIVEASDWGWGSARILGAFGGAALLAAAFVRRSIADSQALHPAGPLMATDAVHGVRHRHPVLELHLFRVRSFAIACAGVGIFSLGFYALL